MKYKKIIASLGGPKEAAELLKLHVNTLIQWFNGTRTPRGPGRVLLDIVSILNKRGILKEIMKEVKNDPR